MNEREFALAVVCRLREAGHQALWAGGCVRDELLGLQPKDYDVATDARPEQVGRLFRRTIAVGVSFGVIEVLGPQPGLRVQVATFRSDGTYSDGRHPDSVRFSSPEEDARRRDFTINGLFFDPVKNRLIDFVGGQADLAARLLRAIGDPRQRFAEDKLRMLRAVRFAIRFDLKFEPSTLDAIKAMADQLSVVSAERITDELRKILMLPGRDWGMAYCIDLGLARAVLPEVDAWASDPGEPITIHSGFSLIAGALKSLEYPSFTLALACLLRPKEQVAADNAGAWAGAICRRLRLSTAESERIAWLVQNRGVLDNVTQMRPSALKKILGHPAAHELVAMHRAEALASGSSLEPVENCERLLAQWTAADLNPPALITGFDVAEMGVEPGPRYKVLLDSIRDAQLDGVIGTRDEAVAMLRQLIADVDC